MACNTLALAEPVAQEKKQGRAVAGWRLMALVILLIALLAQPASAQVDFSAIRPAKPAEAQLEFSGRRDQPIQFSADAAYRFADGNTDVWVLHGACFVNQGLLYTRSQDAVVWVRRDDNSSQGRHQATIYLEGAVSIDQQVATSVPGEWGKPASAGAPKPPSSAPRLTADTWLGNLFTDQEPQVRVTRMVANSPQLTELYARAAARRDPVPGQVARRAQFAAAAGAAPAQGQALAPPPGMRRLRAFPRSDNRVQAEWFPDAANNEWVAVITGGVTIIVDGADSVGSIDISTDRLVIWTKGTEQPDLGGQTLQRDDTPLEFYLEGNIEFRQADRLVTAKSMYYDVQKRVGIVLDAEMLATVKKYEGKLRLQASELRQLSQDRFTAQGAKFTPSRMGEPGVWVQSDNMEFEDHPRVAVDATTGIPLVDPNTGEGVIEHDWQLTAGGDYVFVEGLPIFYWPTLTTTLDDPGFYLKEARFRSDNIFGTQILTDWNAYQLLGIRIPVPGTNWEASFDYLSERGPGVGTEFNYLWPSFAGFDGLTKGKLDAYFIHDSGLDNLGQDYRAVQPSTEERGRLLYNHRQHFNGGYQLTAELGIISDRNFLQQYYEPEWWNAKDETTGVEFKRYFDNSSWAVTADMRLQHFFSTTSWLPRGDHYLLGQSILDDWLTWSSHSSAAYAEYRPATIPPNDPAFQLLPWELTPGGLPANESGGRFATRNGIDMPFQLGVAKVVPYAMGELAHWGEDLDGQPLDRAYGQLGIRASVPMWKVNPEVESQLWNVHGLAHKVTFELDASYSDANQDVTELPLYDPIDDDAIEQFRHQYVFYDFNGVLPTRFDPRYYAIRAGLADNVTSPSTELADDMLAVRMGVHQRWQTKRGMPGAERIIDWITFDTDLVIFPDADRDNFGSYVGLIDYDFRWHVGDRFTILSDGLFDTFSQGQQLVSVGGLLHRPDMGSLYMGVRSLEGPISSQALLASLNYRMSEKWITSLSASVSLGGDTNLTEQLTFTRIGESLLVKFGVYSDEGQGTFGAKLAIEPRFFRSAKHNLIDGIHVPPAGSGGLE